MFQQEASILVALLSLSFLVLLFGALFITFVRRKNALLQARKDREIKFQKELQTIQKETLQNTLRGVSWELHDNIGQMLTLAKIQLRQLPGDHKVLLKTLSQSLDQVRSLSHRINPQAVSKLTLCDAISNEIISVSSIIDVAHHIHCEYKDLKLNENSQLIVVRIAQEFLANTVKYAEASAIRYEQIIENEYLHIKLSDDGKGFDTSQISDGIGISNMKSRAALLQAEFFLDSSIQEGTSLKLTLKLKDHEY